MLIVLLIILIKDQVVGWLVDDSMTKVMKEEWLYKQFYMVDRLSEQKSDFRSESELIQKESIHRRIR